MSEATDLVLNNLYISIDEFENIIDNKLKRYDEKSKRDFLAFVKDLLKEEKKQLVSQKNSCTDDIKKFELKRKNKKVKKKIFLINYKIHQLNKEQVEAKPVRSLNGNQKLLEKAMLEGKEIVTDNIPDFIIAYTHMIDTGKLSDEELIYKYSHEINNQLIDYMSMYNRICPELRLLLNTLNNKVKSNDKDSPERKIYKKVFNDLKDVYEIYKPDNKEANKNPYFEIVMRWLQDEDKYYYIKELIKRKPDICKLNYNSKHLVLYILEEYIKNLKKLMHDKNSDYINEKYLEEVYFLITKNPAFRIKEKDKQEIDAVLDDLEEYIKTTLVKPKRKNYALDKIERMRPDEFYKIYYTYDTEKFNDDKISYMFNELSKDVKMGIRQDTYEDAFLVGNYAYRLTNKEDEITLDMYEILYTHFVPENCELNRYLYQCEMTNEKVDDDLIRNLSFKKDEKYPVIDYKLTFYPSGKFKELTVKKDVVNITKEFRTNKNDEDLVNLYCLYKKSVKKNGVYSDLEVVLEHIYILNNHFENILQNAYIEFLKKEKLLFIYYGRVLPMPNVIEKDLYDLSDVLYDMEKPDAYDIVNIVSSKIDTYHYSNLEIPNGEYKLNLLNPVSLLGMENENMLVNCYFNERLLNDERLHSLKLKFMDDYIKQVSELNTKLDYVDPNLIKHSRGKIKNRIRL